MRITHSQKISLGFGKSGPLKKTLLNDGVASFQAGSHHTWCDERLGWDRIQTVLYLLPSFHTQVCKLTAVPNCW